jgi:hypothetical protein
MSYSPKHLILRALFARWYSACPFDDGYTVLLPSPMDMPFLLRFGLEGLSGVDTTNCRQILVLPDGWGDDDGAALRRVVEEFNDPRVEFVGLTALDKFLTRRMKRNDGAGTHWMMAVRGTKRARCSYAFLHDSDAFFLASDSLERQYLECRDRGMYTLGVTARWDPFFVEGGYTIPGTWELMYSTRWARSHSPYAHKGLKWATARGVHEFDSMLYPQYLDFPSGKVGVMDPPPPIAHFNGTIVTYRNFRERGGRSVVDEYFRILLLAVLEDLMPAADGRRELPTVDELRRGLTDPGAPVGYGSDVAAYQYPIFRATLDELCGAPVFRGRRAERVRGLVRPFDEHFEGRTPVDAAALPRMREHGLG